MSELQSPGVSVRVIDESINTPSSGGTVPLIVAATRRNKTNPEGDIAPATIEDAAGDVTLLTGRSDLLQMFGRPEFKEIGGTMRHGAETNEYGLHAAWQALGISNQAYVLTADIDLDELEETSEEPTRAPEGGTHWLDIEETNIGLFRWSEDSGSWEEQEVEFLNDTPGTGNVQSVANGIANPRDSFGSNGDYVAVTSLAPIVVYEKIGGTWIMLGAEAHDVDFQLAPHTSIPSTRGDGSELEDGDLYIKTTVPNNGTVFDVSSYDSDSGQFITKETPIFVLNDAATEYYEDLGELDEGVVYVKADHEGKLNPDYNVDMARPRKSDGVAVFQLKRWNGESRVEAVSEDDIAEIELESYPESEIVINGVEFTLDSSISSDGDVIKATDIANLLQSSSELKALNIRVELTGNDKRLKLIKKDGKDITVQNVGTANEDWTPNTFTDVASVLGFGYSVSGGEQIYRKSNWESLEYESEADEPTRSPEEGRLWFSQDLRAELLESYFDDNENQVKWRTHSWSGDDGTNDLDYSLSIRGTAPESPSEGDVWIDSTDLDNYPAIRQYRSNDWVLLDNDDQNTTDGVVFGSYAFEAPFDEDGNERSESVVDSDAPNPQIYPEGILLFNMDYSTNNVKEYKGDGVWKSVSGNAPDGSPYMGRFAQRRMVVRAMKEAVLNSKDARARDRFFNLITATGYPELLPELNELNTERKQTAFVIGSSPMRLEDSGNVVQDWATNANDALEDGEEGLVTMNNMSAVWAFAGLQTDSSGNQVAVPSDTMALQVILQNDRQAYQWFAPAGDQRGLVPNTTAIGFVTDNFQFENADFDDGLIDTLYQNNINPIYDDEGIKVFGQKTLTDTASAMDRINVARLVAHLRYMLPRITRPFLFQPNDAQTRQAALNAVEKFLADIVEKRGITDFLVVADGSNNTPERIDRNELWLDISVVPTKSVEFIYIPVRLQNTGDI